MSTAIEPVIEEVATNLDEAATAVRMLDARIMGAFTFGVVTGVAVGFIWGYKYDKSKLRAEIQAEAEEEIARMREYYHQKTIARQGEVEKKQKVEEIVEERGYIPTAKESGLAPNPTRSGTSSVPIIENLPDPPELLERLPAPVPIIEDSPHHDNWDYSTENQKRAQNPRVPYIIHQDEFESEKPAYGKTSYTYYPVDDVLTDEDGSVLDNRDELIGVGTLDRFGHGSDDEDIVYVRNNPLQLHIEIDRLPGRSYEEDVVGLSREDFGLNDNSS